MLKSLLNRPLTRLWLVWFVFLGSTAWGQYTPGNLVVTQVGDGAAALGTAAAQVRIIEYQRTGGSSVNSLTLPTAVSGSNRRLTLTGNAGTEGNLSLSSNGLYLTLAGYDANVGTASLNGAPGIDRVVGRIDQPRNINTTTVLPSLVAYNVTSGNTGNIRSAVTTDGTAIWTAGNSSTAATAGIRYTTLGATDGGVQVSNSVTNTRVVGVFNGQLYASSGSLSFTGVSAVGSGTPTTGGQTMALVAGYGSNSGHGFVFLDRNPNVPGVDLLYIADQTTSNGIRKFSFDGTTWTARGNITGIISGITGFYNCSTNSVELYYTNGTGAANTIVKLVDAAAFDANISSTTTTVATAAANTAFRGIAFAPGTSFAAPTAFNVTGGGFYDDVTPVAIGLSNSQTGMNYQLFRGSTAVGSAVAGTGSALSFPTQTIPGTYTVLTTNALTSCSVAASGSAVVTANPQPPTITNTAAQLTACVGSPLTVTATCASGSVTWSNSTTANTVAIASVVVGSTVFSASCVDGALSSTATSVTVTGYDYPTATLANSNSLNCSVQSATLTASTGAGYSYIFSAGATQLGSTSLATVSTAGTYTVTVTANGCSATATTTVMSDTAAPTATLTASNSLNCAVTSATITASTGAGYSYAFSAGATQIGSTNQAVVTVGGPHTVTITANGCSATATVSVAQDIAAPSAASLTSGTLTCTVLAVTLTASGGVSYSFTTGQTSNTLAVNMPGTYSVLVTGANSCTALVTGTVTSNTVTPALPDFGGNRTATQGSTVSLSNTAACSGTLAWGQTFGGSASGTGTISVPTGQTGILSYTAVCQQGICVSPTQTVSVTITPAPVYSVVISQVYGGGGNSGATLRNDFIELFNRGNTPVDLTGWSVQYAAAGGTGTWSGSTPLSGTILPGRYYLVQQGAGAGGSVNLPTPDAIGNIAMSGTAGKVALISNTTALQSGSCLTGFNVVDFVGFASTANCFEGSGPTPAFGGNANAVFRALDGCQDTNNNAADFSAATAAPRNSASPGGLCTDPRLTSTPSSRSFSYFEGAGPVSATVALTGRNLNPASGNITATISSTAFVVSPTSTAYSNNTVSTVFTVSFVAGLLPTDGPQSGTLTFEGGGATATVALSGTVNSLTITPIATARGMVGQSVAVQGRVTSTTYVGGNRLFYIQDNTGGMAIYSPSNIPDYSTQVQLGDLITVSGGVVIFSGMTELSNLTSFSIDASAGRSVPAPVQVTLDQLASRQGQLVEVINTTIGTPSATFFNANTNYPITQSPNTSTMRINANSELVGAGKPSGPTSITGIVDRFVSGATAAGTDGIQLQPRLLTDVQGATTPTDQICGGTGTTGLTPAQTFDITTWNVEFFGADGGTVNCSAAPTSRPYDDQGPFDEARQARNVKTVIQKLGSDIFVLEEVSDATLLGQVFSTSVGGYSLVCGDKFSYYWQADCDQNPVFLPNVLAQKVCIAYKTSSVVPVQTLSLLADQYGYGTTGPTSASTNNWASGRLPFMFVADVTANGATRRLHIVGLHAKSGSAADDYARRRQDYIDLKNKMMADYPNANIMILGDNNDGAITSITSGSPSSFNNFVTDAANFSVLTASLEQQGCQTFESGSFLDHIIISNEVFPAYIPNSINIQIPVIGLEGGYSSNTTSDHRPVSARFDLSLIPVPSLTLVTAASPTTILTTGTVTLSASVVGGMQPYAYTFVGPGTITPNSNSATVSGLSAGVQTFTVLVRDATTPTAHTISQTVSVTVNCLSLTIAMGASATTSCSSPTVALTASSGFTSYTFSNGQNGVSNTASVTAGVYSVTATDAVGCKATATTTVVGDLAPPTVSLTSSGTITCSQLTAALRATDGLSSYTLSDGQNSLTGLFSVTAGGSYTVRVTGANGCTNTAATSVASNTATPPATLSANSLVLCTSGPGASVTLTASGGTNYAFSGPGLNQNSPTPTATVMQAGAFSVIVTGTNGCTATRTVSLTQTATGLVLGSTPGTVNACTGSPMSIPVVVNGPATTYYWLKNGSPMPGQTTNTLSIASVQPGDAGTYSLSVVGPCGTATSSTFTVVVNPTPTITLVFPGGTLINPTTVPTIQLPIPGQVQVIISGGSLYEWRLVIDRLNGYELRQVETNTSGIFNVSKPGPYRITVNPDTPCSRTVEGVITN
jgi:DNA/RNA endonuclease YhcR with UshA esterase domain